jgi:hypothetical protein
MVPEVRPGDLVHGTGKPSRGLPSTGLSYDWGQGEGKGKILGLGASFAGGTSVPGPQHLDPAERIFPVVGEVAMGRQQPMLAGGEHQTL